MSAPVLVSLSQPYKIEIYDLDGSLMNAYDLPVGSVEGASSDTLYSGCAAPDGSVWIFSITAGAATILRNINPLNGVQIGHVSLPAGHVASIPGYAIQLFSNGEFLLITSIAGTRHVARYSSIGALVHTYGIAAGVVSISLAPDEQSAYYLLGSTVKQWDLVNDAALPDLAVSDAFIYTGPATPDGIVLCPLTTMDESLIGALPIFTAGSGDIYRIFALGAKDAKGAGVDLVSSRVFVACQKSTPGSGGFLNAHDRTSGNVIWQIETLIGDSTNTQFVIFVSETPSNPSSGGVVNYRPTSTRAQLIRRLRQSPTTTDEQLRVFFSRFQLDLQAGTNPAAQSLTLALQWSNDNGYTWSAPAWITAGLIGEYGARAIWNRLGNGRNRVWRVIQTDPVAVAWIGAFVDLDPGVN